MGEESLDEPKDIEATVMRILDYRGSPENQLNQLVDLIQHGNTMQTEDNFFKVRYGITVTDILGYMAMQQQINQNAREILGRTETIKSLIVLPDRLENPLKTGTNDGNPYEQPKVEERVMFIVQELLRNGIDAHNIKVTKGLEPAAEMFRKESYQIIEVKDIPRIILVCNEVGNASFILDIPEHLDDAGYNTFISAAIRSTKSELVDNFLCERFEHRREWINPLLNKFLGQKIAEEETTLRQKILTFHEAPKVIEDPSNQLYGCYIDENGRVFATLNYISQKHSDSFNWDLLYKLIVLLGDKVSIIQVKALNGQIVNAYSYQTIVDSVEFQERVTRQLLNINGDHIYSKGQSRFATLSTIVRLLDLDITPITLRKYLSHYQIKTISYWFDERGIYYNIDQVEEAIRQSYTQSAAETLLTLEEIRDMYELQDVPNHLIARGIREREGISIKSLGSEYLYTVSTLEEFANIRILPELEILQDGLYAGFYCERDEEGVITKVLATYTQVKNEFGVTISTLKNQDPELTPPVATTYRKHGTLMQVKLFDITAIYKSEYVQRYLLSPQVDSSTGIFTDAEGNEYAHQSIIARILGVTENKLSRMLKDSGLQILLIRDIRNQLTPAYPINKVMSLFNYD